MGEQSLPDGGARTDPLFQPLRLKHIELRNRILCTAHASGLDDDGLPKTRYQRYHEEKAKGGIALTMFGGSANVAPDSPSVFRQLYVGCDSVIPYLQEFSERIHHHGAALMCQISHLGRRGDPYTGNWLPTISPSRLREPLHRSFPKEMDEDDIARVVAAFGAAAYRCKQGGLDGIETLGSGHLIGQFLSPATNRRGDRFGGSLENRCRFAVMVHEEIRRRVGDDFVVGLRLSVDETNPDGLSFEDCVAIAQHLEQETGIDFFNGVFGRMDTEIALAEQNMPGMDKPLAPYLGAVGAFKREVRRPVFHAARITDIASARRAVAEGLVDMVGMTRAHIADPHLVDKIARGEEARIRPCVGASYCLTRKPHCIHNAATGREDWVPQVIERSERPGRKVVVVGGGPGGLEAARVAAERGHRVVLLEATNRLGGQLAVAVRAEARRDLAGIIDWRRGELDHLGVDVRCNVYAGTEEVLAEAPDAVIVATGGVPDLDWLDGWEHCASPLDVLAGTVPPGEEVLVHDGTGQHPAATCALHLAANGRHVAFATRDDRLAQELGYTERAVVRKRFHELEIPVLTDHRLARVERRGNRFAAILESEFTGRRQERLVDQVVVEHGTVPVDEVFHALRDRAVNRGVTDLDALLGGRPQWTAAMPQEGFDLHRIGDAVASRNVHAAVYDALRLCMAL